MYQDGNGSITRHALSLLWVLLVPAVALAQDAVQPAGEEKARDEIIVTGSRIPEPNLVSTSPILVVGAEEIKISGKNDVSDILQQLPQVFNNSLGQGLGNTTSGLTTAGGVANADLRGLGPQRTLVLINGRRLGPGSPNTAIQSPSPDLDQIPGRLVERVDVVTGGASATYGSDAIAGVINFIMKKDFEGLEFDASYGFNQHNNDNSFVQSLARDFGADPEDGSVTDGGDRSFDILFGTNSADGRANITGYLSYQDKDPVASGQRDFGSCQVNADTDDDGVPTGTVSCGGSSNSNRFQPKSGPNGDDPTAVFNVFGNQFTPFGDEDTTPPSAFNSQQFIYINRDYERYSAGVIGHYDINEHVKPYAEFGFMNDRTTQFIAPSALFRGSNPLTGDGNYQINCSNPLLSAQQQGILCSPADIAADAANLGPGGSGVPVLASVEIGRRNIEGGGRSSEFEHTNYRAVFGATGEITEGWNYDLYGQYYYTTLYTSNNQYLDFQKITNALQVTSDADGNPVCISGGTCVPYNIFQDGGVTNDQVNYLYTNGTAYGTTRLGTYHFDVTGQLGQYGVQLPTASDGVAVNFGFEKRHERTDFAPDAAELSGNLSGFGGASVAINQGVIVDELFIETRIPLVQNRPGIVDLTVDAGYRNSDYDTSGAEDTYKLGFQYTPVPGARLRASYNRAIRAPSIIELFNPPSVGQIGIGEDPCAPTFDANNVLVPATATLAQCLQTVRPDQAAAFTAAYGNGGTDNQIQQGTASQLAQLTGGNVNLTPEIADTYSFGLSITPELVPQFTGSIDYFNIKLENGIGTLPAGPILNCPFTGNPIFCSQQLRQPITFTLNGATVAGGGYLLQNNQNIAEQTFSGIDLQLAYDLELPSSWGSIDFALAGSYMLENSTITDPGSPSFDCTGLFGSTCQTVNPEWRHVLRTTWQTPRAVTAALTWRYIGPVDQDNNDPNPVLNNSSFAGFDSFNASIASRTYWDLAATYNPLENVEFRAGINNLLDRDPPLVTSEIVSGGAANTYETYDYLGRQIFVGVTVKL